MAILFIKKLTNLGLVKEKDLPAANPFLEKASSMKIQRRDNEQQNENQRMRTK